ncbi:MAG: energy-coupling factor transporter transmembrane protein EcfT [Ruminococcaceae bacterium]|nr:energy-coupling factor transporter transmembrane protein EcfT [Oscillospiraceae bacterium]
MLKDITLGQYFPIDSPLHKMDPRTKILALILLITAIFIAGNPAGYALVTLFTVLVIVLSRVPVKLYFKGLKPIWFVIIFTAALNMFLTPGTKIQIGDYTTPVTWEGLLLAGKMALRLVLLIMASSALTYTTSPIVLTDGIEKLLKPLSKLGVPTYELAMMMSIAIRFIPTLIEETDKIMKAQKARGADFDSGSVFKRVKAMAPMLVPLFISAFRRADELAVAMESRCYQGGSTRTRLNEICFRKTDVFAALSCLAFLAALIIIKIYL